MYYMKGGIFNREECCNQPCECPVCLETKPLMRLNCNHYVCLEDIQHILASNPRKQQTCPICRVMITSYGCNGAVTNVADNPVPQSNVLENENPPLIINNEYYANRYEQERGERTPDDDDDDEYSYQRFAQVSRPANYDSYDELYGGNRRTRKRRRKHVRKTRVSNKRHKHRTRTYKRKAHTKRRR